MKNEFHAGDRVVVRPWEDMAADYEIRDGDIYIQSDHIYFNLEMSRYCGREFVIKKVLPSDRFGTRIELYNQPPFAFTANMFSMADEDDAPDVCADSFYAVLGCC